MGRLTLHSNINIVQLGRSIGNLAHITADIHAVAIISLNPRLIKIYHAQAANFLANGKQQLDITMRYAILLQRAHRLEHTGHAYLVVTAQGSGAIAIKHAVLAHHLGAGGGCYGVHMRFKKQRGCIGHSALHIGPHIAAGAASFFVGLVHHGLQA